MSKLTWAASLAAMMLTLSGCQHTKMVEMDSRVDGADNNAATARLRADEAYEKAEMALEAATKAQKAVEAANQRASRKVDAIPK